MVGHTEQEDGLGWWVGVVGWVGGACTTERMGLLGGLRQGPHGARGEDGALHFGTPAQRFANWSSLPLHVPLPSLSLSLSFYRLFSLSLFRLRYFISAHPPPYISLSLPSLLFFIRSLHLPRPHSLLLLLFPFSPLSSLLSLSLFLSAFALSTRFSLQSAPNPPWKKTSFLL